MSPKTSSQTTDIRLTVVNDENRNIEWTTKEEFLPQPIHLAAMGGEVEVIQTLLKQGADINSPSRGLCTCQPNLPYLAFLDSVYEVMPDFAAGTWTPLHFAICHAPDDVSEDAATYLYNNGASIIVYDNPTLRAKGYNSNEFPAATAIHDATKFNRQKLLQRFLNDFGRARWDDPWLGTPLIVAIYYDQYRWMNETLQRSMAQRMCDSEYFSILNLILKAGWDSSTSTTLIEQLLSYGCRADWEGPNEDGCATPAPPLVVASSHCNIEAMKLLVRYGADVNALDEFGWPALFRVGQDVPNDANAPICEAAQILIENGARLASDDEQVPSLLAIICELRMEHLAWTRGYVQLADIRFKNGIDPNDYRGLGYHALLWVLDRHNFSLAKKITDNGGELLKEDVDCYVQHVLVSVSPEIREKLDAHAPNVAEDNNQLAKAFVSFMQNAADCGVEPLKPRFFWTRIEGLDAYGRSI